LGDFSSFFGVCPEWHEANEVKMRTNS
jgi:hypothetical protein